MANSDLLKKQLETEFKGLVYDEVLTELRQQLLDANMVALSPGEMSQVLRDQAIGRVDGLLTAIEIVTSTYEQMFKED